MRAALILPQGMVFCSICNACSFYHSISHGLRTSANTAMYLSSLRGENSAGIRKRSRTWITFILLFTVHHMTPFRMGTMHSSSLLKPHNPSISDEYLMKSQQSRIAGQTMQLLAGFGLNWVHSTVRFPLAGSSKTDFLFCFRCDGVVMFCSHTILSSNNTKQNQITPFSHLTTSSFG